MLLRHALDASAEGYKRVMIWTVDTDMVVKIKKKHYFIFSNYRPLQNLALKTCSQDISKTITASSLQSSLRNT